MKIILPHTSKLSSFVQGTRVDIHKVKSNAELTIRTLEGCRNESSFDMVWERAGLQCNKIKQLLESNDIDFELKEAKLPRTRRPSVRRQALVGEGSSGDTQFTDVKVYHRVLHYYPALDLVTSELRNRFAENDHDVLLSLSSLIFEESPSDEQRMN